MPHIENIQIVAAPSILGLRPTGVERLPASLLSNGLQEKLNATSPLISVPTFNNAYDHKRNTSGVLNEQKLEEFSVGMYHTILKTLQENKFPLVLGGDCSIIVGILAALKARGRYGLIFLDAHADFYLPHESPTGEAADMDLAMVTGRGPSSLTNLYGLNPYVMDEHVFQIGQRDIEEAEKSGSHRIQDTGINCFDYRKFEQHDITHLAAEITHKANDLKVDGYWIHFDTDVLSDNENPAADYRLPGGLSFEQCEYLLRHFLRAVNVVGLTVTIFNPVLDETGAISARITRCIQHAFQ